MNKPTDEQIRIRAHKLWEQAGKPEGRDEEFWQQAEQQLQAGDFGPEPDTLLPG